jgi:hypothetical protein
MVRWGNRRLPADERRLREALTEVLRGAQALFVAVDVSTRRYHRTRGQQLTRVLKQVIKKAGLLHIPAHPNQLKDLPVDRRATKGEIAATVSKMFPHLAHHLPLRRAPWQSEDERIGRFVALAAAVAIWEDFKGE